MKLIKVYVADDFKDLVDEKAKKSNMKTSSFAGALIKHGMEVVQDGQLDECDTPHTNNPVRITFNKETSGHIKERCKELGVSPEQYIDSLIYEKPEPVVVSPFLEDYKEEMSRIEEQIDSMCYYITQNEYQLVSDDVMQSLHEKLDEIGTLFAAIYKKCSREENLTIKRKKGHR